MRNVTLRKSDAPRLVDFLMKSGKVLAPKRKGEHFAFGEIEHSAEVVLIYPTTILPPKKFFQPERETLVRFDMATQKAEAPAPVEGQRILLGVHPCDMAGILRLDWAFTQGEAESNWIERRKATVIFGVTQSPDEYVFSESVEANSPVEGYDGFFFVHGDHYVISIYTEAGEAVMADFPGFQTASDAEVAAAKGTFERAAERQTKKLTVPVASLPLLLKGTFSHSEWTKVADKCLSCGSCTLVCPTCYCFDVDDTMALDLASGERQRRWDSCQLHDFTTVAGDHTFREKRENRAKHRVYRKFKYMVEEGGWKSFCVGCGRCIRACPADIDIVDICNNINAGS